jgi:urease subunit gamma/beta
MHLTPRERERLLLAAAADLARRRLARGARIGATEAVALVSDEICEMAWDGVPLDAVITRARQVVPPSSLLPGVAGLVPVLEVEALFPWGSALVHVDSPFGAAAENYPERPGVTLVAPGSIELAAGAERRSVTLRNTGARDVWISSHYPLAEVNAAIEVSGFAGPCRLDLPAGEALLVRAGEERPAVVVVVAGELR